MNLHCFPGRFHAQHPVLAWPLVGWRHVKRKGFLQTSCFSLLPSLLPSSIATCPLHLPSLQHSSFAPEATELYFGSPGNTLLFIYFKDSIYFMCVGILPTYMSVQHVCALFSSVAILRE